MPPPEELVSKTDGNSGPRLDLGQGTTGTIHEHEDGFTISVLNRPSMTVLCVGGARFDLEGPSEHRQRFGLTETQDLFDTIVRLVRRPQKGIGNVTRVKRALADPVRRQCDRLLQALHPNVLAVYKALSAVSTERPQLAMCPHLYRHTDLVHDIINYRAAAIVVASFESLVPSVERNRINASSQADELRVLAKSRGLRLSIDFGSTRLPPASDGCEVCISQALPYLLAWRDLLSPSGHSYRSLDRTLMNLAPEVPAHLVCLLSRIRLPRPISDRLELALVTLAAQHWRHGALNSTFGKVFANARAPEIRKALRRVARSTRNELQETRERDLKFFIYFLSDCREQHHGTIVGLADKAVRWHQRRLAAERSKVLDRYGAQTRTKLPSIPLPSDPAVHHLSTVAEIVQEGEQMRHCVANYVPSALNDQYYLFHVEHEGEAATVMVHGSGQVLQSLGPSNQRNQAAQWGAQRLSLWARALTRHEPREDDAPGQEGFAW